MIKKILSLIFFSILISFSLTSWGKTGFLNYNGTRIHYLKEGHGKETLLFIHGLPLSAKSWECQINYFKKKYTVVAIDLPGYGLSSRLPSPDMPNLSQFYSDIISDALKQLNIKKAVYIGFATGGHVGMKFAIDHADQVSKLVLINTSPKFTTGSDWSFGFNKDSQQKIIQMIQKDDFKNTIKFLLDVATQENCPEKIMSVRKSFTEEAMLSEKNTLLSFFTNLAEEDF